QIQGFIHGSFPIKSIRDKVHVASGAGRILWTARRLRRKGAVLAFAPGKGLLDPHQKRRMSLPLASTVPQQQSNRRPE
ncbi:MAG: hypothetical protein WC830_05985, partial [Burkholderiales bacterium]